MISSEQRLDAQQALDAVYGTNNYRVSDDDIEMMLEFEAIRKNRLNNNRNLLMKEATGKRGVEW